MNIVSRLKHKITQSCVVTELQTHGHVLYRDTGITSIADVSAVSKAIYGNLSARGYHGTDHRNNVGDGVLDTGAVVLEHPIPSHHEANYEPIFPRGIAFACLVPPPNAAQQGQTAICDSIRLMKDIPSTIISKLEEHDIQYIRNFHSHCDPNRDPVVKSWQEMYGVDKECELSAVLSSIPEISEWSLHSHDQIRVVQTYPAFLLHPVQNQRVFFNQALAMNYGGLIAPGQRLELDSNMLRYHTQYGNGDEFTTVELQAIAAAYTRNELEVCWEQGDLLILDNLWFSHAKRPCYTGPRSLAILLDVNVSRDDVEHERRSLHG